LTRAIEGSAEDLEWIMLYRPAPLGWLVRYFDGDGRRAIIRNYLAAALSYVFLPRGPIFSCNFLINASGPLLYRGQRVHAYWQPWSVVLRNVLRKMDSPAFLNLAFGAGLSQDAISSGRFTYLDRRLARSLVELAAVTTCRDSIVHTVLQSAGLRCPIIPCPSLFARNQLDVQNQEKDYIVVNFSTTMTKIAHIRECEADQPWVKMVTEFLGWMTHSGLRWKYICHDPGEYALILSKMRLSPKDVMLPRDLRTFLSVYGSARAAVTQRVHGALAAASFAVPSICIGVDSRVDTARVAGVKTLTTRTVKVEVLRSELESLLQNRESVRRRLVRMRDEAERAYLRLLRKVLTVGSSRNFHEPKTQFLL